MKKDTVLVVNTILAECWRRNVYPRPMKLQKLLYFCYGEYLAKTDKDLISDSFEAWGYGCVVQEVYHAFKHWGYREIGSLLVEEGEEKAYILSETSDKYPAIRKVLDKYGHLSDIELSDINHQVDGAWWSTKKNHTSIVDRKDIMGEFST